MTECLPATDITLAEMRLAGPGNGVCVGLPVSGVDVRISAVDRLGVATGPLSQEPGTTGEIVLRAAHMKARYDRAWVLQEASARPRGWHRDRKRVRALSPTHLSQARTHAGHCSACHPLCPRAAHARHALL